MIVWECKCSAKPIIATMRQYSYWIYRDRHGCVEWAEGRRGSEVVHTVKYGGAAPDIYDVMTFGEAWLRRQA